MIAVLLLGFGSPEKLSDVARFVESVAGRPLPPERLAASVDKYALIGGVSPFCASARAQTARLEDSLKSLSEDIKVYLGMRFSEPSIGDAVATVLDAKPDRIILVCLTPYYSRASAGEYLKTAEEALAAGGNTAPVARVDQWNDEPALIAGFADLLIEALATVPSGTPVLFTAHSLPQDMIDAGDPYAAQVEATVLEAAEAAGLKDWFLGWQSEGHGRGAWLKPTVEEILTELAAAGRTAVLIMPIGFTADHMETLYDIDIVMKEQAGAVGLAFNRADCLNDADAVIAAMQAAIERTLQTKGW